MAEIIRMPKMSDTMETGVLVRWLKEEGDTLSSGDMLAEVETDKAVMELENYEKGVLLHKAVKEGASIKVNALIAIVGKKGEDFKQLLDNDVSSTSAEDSTQEKDVPSAKDLSSSKPTSAVVTEDMPVVPAGVAPSSERRIKASPLAKKLAKEKQYNLEDITGTGNGSRIVKRDVLTYRPASPLTHQGREHYVDTPVSQMRQTIAKRLSQSKFTAPHFYLSIEAEVSKLVGQRKVLNKLSSTKISFNDLVVKATAHALLKHPTINSSWQESSIRTYEHVHIGIAVAVPDGLFVPVLRFVNQKSLQIISSETKELAAQAKEKTLKPEQWEGSTFAISNLGMYGIEEFTAIINSPNACILAVGGITEKPVVQNGKIQIGKCLKLTLSCDHRVVDGATGAAFLKDLKELLEYPIAILL